MVDVDPYVIETLLPDLVGHDHRPSAFLVYLFLWHATHAARRGGVAVSLRSIAEGTGLSKRSVQTALVTLKRRRLLSAAQDGPTDIPRYTVHKPWARTR
jgi:hypothetical protein